MAPRPAAIRHRSGYASAVLVSWLVWTCTGCGSAGAPALSGTAQPGGPEASPFRIVGYVTDTGPLASEQQLRQLTHINYAFALPREDGTLFAIANPWKLEQYVETAHRHEIKVLISVGGWGWDDEFEALAATPDARTRFVGEVTGLVDEFGLDGADIDWEYPDPGASADAFTALMNELRAALPSGKLLTAAVAALQPGADGIAADTFETVDFLNVMAYDGSGSHHSPISYAQDALSYWTDRGLAADKTVLGVPFYSRPTEVAYRELIEADPAAADSDEIEYYGTPVNYNGRETIARKTQLAMDRASGIMIWTILDDATDDASLLRAIHETLDGPGD